MAETPFDLIERDDATAFPASRRSFLRHWIAAPGHVGQALLRGGRLVAWGVIRPCRRGRKIGPLFADDRSAAEAVFAELVGEAGGVTVYDDYGHNPTELDVTLRTARSLTLSLIHI